MKTQVLKTFKKIMKRSDMQDKNTKNIQKPVK